MFHFPTKVKLFKKIPDPVNPGRYLKDDYGDYLLQESTVNVALDLKQSITRDREGAEIATFMDVDFPASIEYGYGDELEYIDPLGQTYRGQIKTIEENTDPLGIRVLSRFSNIG